MSEHQVVVVFDVTADSQEAAAQVLVSALDVRGGVGKVVADDMAAGGAQLESWWLPEAHLKHLDGNDNGAMHLEPDAPPLDVYVADDAEDTPTVWLHRYDAPDRPMALLQPGNLGRHGRKLLWEHIVRGLPTGPPADAAVSA